MSNEKQEQTPAPSVPDPELATEAERATQFLERIAADMRQLALLDEGLRVRLVTAAGQMSRPDRYTRKALGKALIRERIKQKRAEDTAILDQTGIRALRRETVFRTPLPMPKVQLDAPVRDDDAGDVGEWGALEAQREQGGDEAGTRVHNARFCYVCKTEFFELHHFYDQMCAPCAAFNWEKRNQEEDLTGRIVLVTGARVKIGYQAAIKLLRAGAEVIVATRFPRDAARRFAAEVDAAAWAGKLHVYGVDLRHTPSVEAMCQHLVQTLPRLDGIINNACQTVRRPSGWYDHVVAGEHDAWRTLTALEQGFLGRNRDLRAQLVGGGVAELGDGDGVELATTEMEGSRAIATAGLWRSAVMTQVPLLAEDSQRGEHLYPAGRLDADLQQVDLRDTNSWRLALADVPTAELLEVQLVNAVAPFVINARLKPLMARVATRDTHIVNVSAMEGQFYRRWKTDKHPHTNMAKAALNMMTRTSAADYVKDGIHMNSVDTGWVTDEDPVAIAARKVAVHRFHPPLDIVDGAARIVAQLFDGIGRGEHVWGVFLKDYKPAPW